MGDFEPDDVPDTRLPPTFLTFLLNAKQTHFGQSLAQYDRNDLKGPWIEELAAPAHTWVSYKTACSHARKSLTSLMIWQLSISEEVYYLESTSLLPETRLRPQDSKIKDLIVIFTRVISLILS